MLHTSAARHLTLLFFFILLSLEAVQAHGLTPSACAKGKTRIVLRTTGCHRRRQSVCCNLVPAS